MKRQESAAKVSPSTTHGAAAKSTNSRRGNKSPSNDDHSPPQHMHRDSKTPKFMHCTDPPRSQGKHETGPKKNSNEEPSSSPFQKAVEAVELDPFAQEVTVSLGPVSATIPFGDAVSTAIALGPLSVEATLSLDKEDPLEMAIATAFAEVFDGELPDIKEEPMDEPIQVETLQEANDVDPEAPSVAQIENEDHDVVPLRKRNRFKDWRNWVMCLQLLAIIALIIALLLEKRKKCIEPAAQVDFQSGIKPSYPPKNVEAEATHYPTLRRTDPPTQAPVQTAEQPTAPEPTNPPTQAPVQTTVQPDQESTPLGAAINRSDGLAYCSDDGGPSVLLNPFSLNVVIAASALDEEEKGVVINSVLTHLWDELSRLSGFSGLSINMDCTLPTFNVEGCVRLADDSSLPSHEEIQNAINTAFSGAELELWLSLVNGDGVDITSVTALSENGNQIDSASI